MSDLQPVTTDQLNGASANRQDGARLDISANGVWGGRFEKTHFNVRVLNLLAPTNRNHWLVGMHVQDTQARKEKSIQATSVRSGTSFVHPLGLVCNWRNEATTFFKHLALLLAEKWDSHYSSTLGWLRCRLSFSLLSSSIKAIRGAWSSRGHAVAPHTAGMDLVISQASLQVND